MAYPTTITMFVNDTQPIVTARLIQRKTSNILVGTNVDSIYFAKYDLDLGAMDGAFPKVATWSDQDGGIAKYSWATDGSETNAVGRFALYFILYWGAVQTEPQNTWSAELKIKNPWEAMD